MAQETIKGSTTEVVVKPAQPADMEQFRATPYYQGLGIEALQGQLAGYTTDDAALRQQAEAQYRPTYDAEVEALRQQLAQQVQGYGGQIEGIGASYDRQRRSTNEAYDQSAVQLDNALTKRGLGRSSLVASQGAYLEKQRNRALEEIDRDENQAISAINERIAQLTDQAAQSERTLAGNYARQLENRVNELKTQNRNASVSLQLQIAALQQQGYEAYQDWLLRNREQELSQKEFEARYGGKSSSGSSSRAAAAGTGKAATQKTQERSSVLGGVIESLKDAVRNTISKGKTAASSGTAEERTNRIGASASKRRNAME